MFDNIYTISDLHSDIYRLTEVFTPGIMKLTRNDLLVVLGDAGIVFANDPGGILKENEKLDWFCESKPFTMLCVIGNHDNYDRIMKLPSAPFLNGKARQLRQNIYFAENGVYDNGNESLLVINGAESIDKAWRTKNVDYWEEELPSDAALLHVYKEVKNRDLTVDHVFTHSFGYKASMEIGLPQLKNRRNSLTEFLDMIKNNCVFCDWSFGHYHVDCEYPDGVRACYRRLRKL